MHISKKLLYLRSYLSKQKNKMSVNIHEHPLKLKKKPNVIILIKFYQIPQKRVKKGGLIFSNVNKIFSAVMNFLFKIPHINLNSTAL